jgi:hypothetical protein
MEKGYGALIFGATGACGRVTYKIISIGISKSFA